MARGERSTSAPGRSRRDARAFAGAETGLEVVAGARGCFVRSLELGGEFLHRFAGDDGVRQELGFLLQPLVRDTLENRVSSVLRLFFRRLGHGLLARFGDRHAAQRGDRLKISVSGATIGAGDYPLRQAGSTWPIVIVRELASPDSCAGGACRFWEVPARICIKPNPVTGHARRGACVGYNLFYAIRVN